ncbi:MAG: isopentenyl-diphosphate Delta-isomerase [Gemmatimonadota bacterium]|nr:isopentenyl-diphosphate Delta-isomerase [Gemmatimonadota bacterium]
MLVDARDRVVGSAPKLDAHRSGMLHRAFSVFVFDAEGSLLLQQRARRKYHSGGLWTNTCCGHPRPGETTVVAARRRLREEMGIACTLEEAGSFLYRAEVGGGLVEHELDHVLVGYSRDEPVPDPLEVAGWRRVQIPEVYREVTRVPARFTAWFTRAFEIALRAPAVIGRAGGAS